MTSIKTTNVRYRRLIISIGEFGVFDVENTPIALPDDFDFNCEIIFTKSNIYYKGKLYVLIIRLDGDEPGFSIMVINVDYSLVAESIIYIEHLVHYPEDRDGLFTFTILDTDDMNGIVIGKHNESTGVCTATLLTFDDDTIQATTMTDEFTSRIISLIKMKHIIAIHQFDIYWIISGERSGIINLNTGIKTDIFFLNIQINYVLYDPCGHLRFAD